MEWLGIILIWSALPLVYLRPGAWKLGMVLLFGGLGYQLWLNVTLKRRMEEQETQGPDGTGRRQPPGFSYPHPGGGRRLYWHTGGLPSESG